MSTTLMSVGPAVRIEDSEAASQVARRIGHAEAMIGNLSNAGKDTSVWNAERLAWQGRLGEVLENALVGTTFLKAQAAMESSRVFLDNYVELTSDQPHRP